MLRRGRSDSCRPQCPSVFFSETPGLIKAKLHVEHPMEGETKVCVNGPGHMTKMAAMAINIKKTLKKSSSPEPKGL